MIYEMAGMVQQGLDETTADFEEYANFCDDEAVAKDYAIKDGTESVEELSVTCLPASSRR